MAHDVSPLLEWIGGGIAILAAYGFIATFQDDPNFGRILAAYGGVFVAGSLAWGVIIDGFRPDRFDLPRRRRTDHVRPTGRLTGGGGARDRYFR